MRLVPVILAGGTGTRLWPASRDDLPKQFLSLTGDWSLLQQTVRRLEGLEAEVTLSPPMVVCNARHRLLVRDQLAAAGHPARAILVEPAARNTAPALCAAAMACESPADAILLVMPADHHIGDGERFHEALVAGLAAAAGGALVTFGIRPDRAETGYGYIRVGPAAGETPGVPRRVRAFVEKPHAALAAEYLGSGRYLWNSGMFMLRPQAWLDAVALLRPDIHDASAQSVREARREGLFTALDPDSFAGCPDESIDRAVFERLGAAAPAGGPRAVVVPLAAGWSDVGSWSSLRDIGVADPGENAVFGNAHVERSSGCLIRSEGRLVVALGLEGTVIVETPDALLVASAGEAQGVGEVVRRLKQAGRPEAISGFRELAPWGMRETLWSDGGQGAARLTIHPGAAMAGAARVDAQCRLMVVRGEVMLERGARETALAKGASELLDAGEAFALRTLGEQPAEVLEIGC